MAAFGFQMGSEALRLRKFPTVSGVLSNCVELYTVYSQSQSWTGSGENP